MSEQELVGAGPAVESSSRTGDRGAGWTPETKKTLAELPDARWVELTKGQPRHRKGTVADDSALQQLPSKLNWFRLNVLWGSRNDLLARLSDPTAKLRRRHVGTPDPARLVVDLRTPPGQESDGPPSPGAASAKPLSFLLMGDTGEGDCSQYALVPPLNAVAERIKARFLFVCSDVIYPVGRLNEYAAKFYHPYRTVKLPVYAIPGNHDWYDGLEAFMANFVGPDAVGAAAGPTAESGSWLARVRNRCLNAVRELLWSNPNWNLDQDLIQRGLAMRDQPSQQLQPPQPGPYFTIETDSVRFVCIDTGILGGLDADQGRWLREVSADEKPKILLTGKPLVVDGRVEREYRIDGAPEELDTVLKVAHHPDHHYVAVIGGDVHNYQHYLVRLKGHGRRPDRDVHHVVSGGGGAFMHATHLVPKVAVDDDDLAFDESRYRAYPLRLDSLAAFSRVLQDEVSRLRLPLKIKIDDLQAAQLINERFKKRGDPEPYPDLRRPSQHEVPAPPPKLSWLQRVVNRGILVAVGGRRFQRWLAPALDWDRPPFFKHFLQLEVGSTGVHVRCYAVTGLGGEDEIDPPVEEEFTIDLGVGPLGSTPSTPLGSTP